ncbi:FAD-dependent oxidoreductase [Salinicoccus halodurans]|uniref:Dehydrogenase n=1 Tax=Salinicoccus halodurans TaxID=407035 RepID=A0A0F7HNE5_9STAP|nr:FAD-dependent oxidoreductase [Salinicoccus halodurans]AKG74642.1 dehydrogenase [Salinicoccus halodurans]SFK88944.1 NADPH-dependent 2,4-dienoyl-CoA reductase, sulfur reductase [Salinicoccus halodurans]
MKKIVIIGSVAAGTSVAAKARRNDENVEITVYDKDTHISYSVCGIPYFIGGEVEEVDELTPRDAKWFKDRFNIDIHTQHEVLNIDKENKTISVKNLMTGEIFDQAYDELVLSTGSRPKELPQLDSKDYKNAFQVKNINDAKAIHQYIKANHVEKIAIIGGGFIGLEMLEQLAKYQTTIIQRSTFMSNLDPDMSYMIEEYLQKKANVITGETIEHVVGADSIEQLVLQSGTRIDADMVILAVGVQPNTSLAEKIGVKIGITGAIQVNQYLETNIPHVYAIGDVTESFSIVSGQPLYRPLGSTANKMGRIVGDRLTGGDLEHKGILGTGIVRVFDMTIAQTGLTEKDANQLNMKVDVIHNIKPNQPEYMKGKEMVIKAIIDKETSRIVGAQIVGYEGVDKRIDVLVTAITFGAKIEDLFHLDLAYAPTFSTTKDPIIYTGMIGHNIQRGRNIITPKALTERAAQEDIHVIDVRSPKQYEVNHVKDAVNVPLKNLRDYAEEVDKDQTIVTYCNKGTTGNAAQNVLINLGFENVYNLSGGNKNYQRYVNSIDKRRK